jgi:hypothetical protein
MYNAIPPKADAAVTHVQKLVSIKSFSVSISIMQVKAIVDVCQWALVLPVESMGPDKP